MAELRIKRAKPIAAEIRVPGDRSISHAAAVVAALSNGSCHLTGFLPSEDCLQTVRALEALGTKIDFLNGQPTEEGGPFRPTQLVVHGRGRQLTVPEVPIDCGSSATTFSLLAGLLAGQPFSSSLQGQPSLGSRGLHRVLKPLEAMGAKISSGAEGQPPVQITASEGLNPIEYDMPVPSNLVSSSLLLAGLSTGGKTTVIEPRRTRDHLERILGAFQVKTLRSQNRVSVYGQQTPESRPFAIPGDISNAAYWLVAAAAQPGAELSIRKVGLNPTRSGILRVLINMGAHLADVVEGDEMHEPSGTVTVRGSSLRGIKLGGEAIASVRDELPIIAVAGALAGGTTVIRDAGELRVMETDQISAVANNLRAFGVDVDEDYDGMTIHGGSRLRGSRVGSFGDHRIGMAFAIAGLHAEGETVIEDSECILKAYPNFEEHIREFQSHRITQEGSTRVISSLQGTRTAKRSTKEKARFAEPETPETD